MTERSPEAGFPAGPGDEEGRALVELLFRLADDDLVIGHRHSEWTGFAPHIEADVALSSIAQDEIGHGAAFYDLLSEFTGESVDRLVYEREPGAFRNAVLLEWSNGGPPGLRADDIHLEGHGAAASQDWAFSVVRHFLYDEAETVRLRALSASAYAPLARVAAKILREESYHLVHASAWMERLASAGGDGPARLATALQWAWPAALAMFEETEADAVMAAADLFPGGTAGWKEEWHRSVAEQLQGWGLEVPGVPAGEEVPSGRGGRRGRHSPDLDRLLEDLTMVYRLDPGAVW